MARAAIRPRGAQCICQDGATKTLHSSPELRPTVRRTTMLSSLLWFATLTLVAAAPYQAGFAGQRETFERRWSIPEAFVGDWIPAVMDNGDCLLEGSENPVLLLGANFIQQSETTCWPTRIEVYEADLHLQTFCRSEGEYFRGNMRITRAEEMLIVHFDDDLRPGYLYKRCMTAAPTHSISP